MPKVKSTRWDFFFSLVDQAAVSGANFLTIALGAAYLPLIEQGKLIYIYTGYIALVLFNISTFFSVANVVRHDAINTRDYRSVLLSAQAMSAIFTAACLLCGFAFFQSILGWEITALEMVLMVAYWVSQQLADFFRRAGYVFDEIRKSAMQSIWLYGARIALLVIYQPETVTSFLVAMLLPGLPITIVGFIKAMHSHRHLIDQTYKSGPIWNHLSLAKWNIYGTPLRWIGLHFPIMLVGALHSLESAAILGSIRAITTFANILFELFETLIPAWLSSKIGQGANALKSGSLNLFYVGAILWLGGTVAIWVGGDWVIQRLLGSAYTNQTVILYILWAGNGIYFSCRVITLYYRMNKNTLLEFYSLLAGMVGFLLSIPLISAYGALGGAYCLMVTQFATLTGLLLKIR